MRLFTSLLALPAVAECANVVSMNIARNPAAAGKIMNARGLGKRSGTITESLVNNVTAGSYIATVHVGTPPQTMSLVLDTGSSDVWVVSSTADVCQQDSREGSQCFAGSFDSKASTSFDDIIPGGFSIQYQDNTGAVGDYFTDNLSFGNVTVSKLQMGLGSGQTDIPQGIMGVGYDTNEATAGIQGGKKYPNIIDELVDQKLINIEAYSLYLDDLNASTGSILFGGIDTAKYTGSLVTIPIQADPSTQSTNISSFTVALTGVTTSDNGKTTDDTGSSAIPVVLDSGTTLSYLPKSITNSIYKTFGAINDIQNSGMVLADCDLATSSASSSINFQFASSTGPVISVGITELLFEIPNEEFEEFQESPPFTNTCLFGIFEQDEEPFLLGDTFLRSAYVVYDLHNNEIGLANSSFDSENSNIVEFAASASGIPSATGVASGVAVTQTATGLPGVGLQSSGSSFAVTPTGASSPASASRSASSFSIFTPSAISVSTSDSASSHVSISTTSSHISTATSTLSSSASSKSALGTASSNSAAMGSVPAFEMGGLLVFTVSVVFSLAGGIWYVV